MTGARADLFGRIKATWAAADADNAGLLAAGVAFYVFLAILPLLAAVVLIYGLVADPSTVAEHAIRLQQLLPAAAANLIVDQLRAVASADQAKTGFGLLVAIFAAIWSATKGAKSVIVALNLVRGIEDSRGFLGRTAIALLITVAMAVAAVGGLVAMTALGFIDSFLPGLAPAMLAAIRAAFWLGAALLAAWGLSLVYRYAPNDAARGLRLTWPGALGATLLWLAATLAFGIYTANFASYNATYGALGAVVVTLLWLYISAYVLILGAEWNKVSETQKGGQA